MKMSGTSREWFEVSSYIVACCVVLSVFAFSVLKDLRRSMANVYSAKNDEYVLLAVKIWSGVFIAVVAILLLLSGKSIPLLQLNLFLVISLSGILVDQWSIFPHLFILVSAVSWYDIYFAFMNSPSGVSVSRLLEPKWIIAFYAMTSCVISGHLREQTSLLSVRTSVVQFACVFLAFSLSLPIESLCTYLTSAESGVESYCSRWNLLPIRMEEMELGPNHRIVCLLFMAFLHIGTRFLILSADTEPPVDSKKTDDVSPEDTPSAPRKSSPYHRYAAMPSDIEGDRDDNSGAAASEVAGELPSDCVEVSEEEAVRLVEGPNSVNLNSSGSSSSSGVSQRKR